MLSLCRKSRRIRYPNHENGFKHVLLYKILQLSINNYFWLCIWWKKTNSWCLDSSLFHSSLHHIEVDFPPLEMISRKLNCSKGYFDIGALESFIALIKIQPKAYKLLVLQNLSISWPGSGLFSFIQIIMFVSGSFWSINVYLFKKHA